MPVTVDPESPNAWLFLAAGDDRSHGGNDGYFDIPDSHYSWDSTVPNHARPSRGDAVVVRNKQTLIGASIIEDIAMSDGQKLIYKCPNCGRGDISERKTLLPRFRCTRCKSEFDEPKATEIDVTMYRSKHDAGWVDLAGQLTGRQLRDLTLHPTGQHSISPLKWADFLRSARVADFERSLGVVNDRSAAIAGGHKSATVRVRVGQAAFRADLFRKFGALCAFTGEAPPEVLEACHLYSYASSGEHHTGGGLLIRRDVHRLFDLGEIAVNPKTLKVDVSEYAKDFSQYEALQDQELAVGLTPGEVKWFARHWRTHR